MASTIGIDGNNPIHPELQLLRIRLQNIHDAISNFQPSSSRPPILDSSLDVGADAGEEGQWLQQENIPGLKKLRDSIKIDLDVLEKFLDNPESIHLPPLSTNAPYLIAVWKEVLCAAQPIVSVFKMFQFNPSSEPVGPRKRGAPRPPGTKVDVVAVNGRRWIRVNTIKNSRMLAEFREIDSYLTESEDEADDDWEDKPATLAQTEFDNSVLRMGRSLLEAAQANPIEGTTEIPRVTIRLTRLNPSLVEDSADGSDPRIAKTIRCLRDMDIDVELGERSEAELPEVTPVRARSPSPSDPPEPSIRINLDLSVLIALISDLTHAPLPASIDEANTRFIPPQHYREWKKKRNHVSKKARKEGVEETTPAESAEMDSGEVPNDLAKHSRALTNQLLQEMSKGLLQEISHRISSISSQEFSSTPAEVEFWTTPEARERCLRIVSKIGGSHEKRRANAIFAINIDSPSEPLSVSQSEELYWRESRFPSKFIPLLPLHLYPPSSIPDLNLVSDPILQAPASPASFFRSLGKTCKDILAQETIPHPRALPEALINALREKGAGEIQRATVTKANPRLTAHTVQSMIWGADLGWTTLTANRTSVKAILREIKIARIAGRLDEAGAEGEKPGSKAAIWIIDPRSLAEGMSSYSSSS
ncbi:hypothetical protein BDQ12DRAFT_639392 [Crucibulum laeve]|uniref:DUF1308 domain-containing protein n=1 Tax=Crucibulum laeve TaxID=68775 RepID=A0A5C3LT36_9AGAR|nr:hypothetical protein BDQ12DRAFT_639392 [Crucibulum laeve]